MRWQISISSCFSSWRAFELWNGRRVKHVKATLVSMKAVNEKTSKSLHFRLIIHWLEMTLRHFAKNYEEIAQNGNSGEHVMSDASSSHRRRWLIPKAFLTRWRCWFEFVILVVSARFFAKFRYFNLLNLNSRWRDFRYGHKTKKFVSLNIFNVKRVH